MQNVLVLSEIQKYNAKPFEVKIKILINTDIKHFTALSKTKIY